MSDCRTTSLMEPVGCQGFDDASIADLVAEMASKYEMMYSCIAIDMGDRLELRAKHGPLPRSVEAAPYTARLARITALRKIPKIVYDAKQDDRYVQDPLVAGAPEVRLFVGTPILVDPSTCMGMLCLMSPEPTESFSLNDCGELLAAAEAIAEQYRKLSTQRERAQATTPTMDSLAAVGEVRKHTAPESHASGERMRGRRPVLRRGAPAGDDAEASTGGSIISSGQ